MLPSYNIFLDLRFFSLRLCIIYMYNVNLILVTKRTVTNDGSHTSSILRIVYNDIKATEAENIWKKIAM